MSKGYHVFRSCSPTAPCDLISMKDGKCLRMEVRMATRSSDGNLVFPMADHDKAECTIAVTLDNEATISYYPPIE